jgi:hypothetical protein
MGARRYGDSPRKDLRWVFLTFQDPKLREADPRGLGLAPENELVVVYEISLKNCIYMKDLDGGWRDEALDRSQEKV